MADLIVTFRAVGIFCYFDQVNINQITLASNAPTGTPDPSTLSETSTVKDIMLALMWDKNNVTLPTDTPGVFEPNFAFTFSPSENTIESISYTYQPQSTRPWQTSAVPGSGRRSIASNLNADPKQVWQYYRSVSGKFPENTGFTEIKLVAANYQQPPFGTTPLNQYYDGSIADIPGDFTLNNYNLTWRCVSIDFTTEGLAKYKARAGY